MVFSISYKLYIPINMALPGLCKYNMALVELIPAAKSIFYNITKLTVTGNCAYI